jgi:hypothetical protein
MSNREKWLNGWTHSGGAVLLGSALLCVGCGKYYGTTCFCPSEGASMPDKDPDWPFNESSCPLCKAFEKADIIPGQLERIPDSMLRMELIRRKKLNRTGEKG